MDEAGKPKAPDKPTERFSAFRYPYVSNSQYFLPNLMDMGSILGTILRAILNYKRVPMSTLNPW